ncbi:hypothetical protein ACFWUW_27735 [Streptomyces sp. NPDC058655]|uniref:hypothetical protein n=1 Tax=Streptomyces sp. NPDC058655 TaxID=3346577 RepID=UPI003652D40E
MTFADLTALVILSLLPGIFWLFLIMTLLLAFLGGRKYLTCGGDPGDVTAARNSIIYGVMGSLVSAMALTESYIVHSPSTGDIFRGIGVGCVLSVASWLALAGTLAPNAAAAYSSWWMPQAERRAHQQDVSYALSHVHAETRIRLAWELLTSSPRAGLRARRYTARLAALVRSGE